MHLLGVSFSLLVFARALCYENCPGFEPERWKQTASILCRFTKSSSVVDVIQQRERLVVPSQLAALNPIQTWFRTFCLQNERRYPWLIRQCDRLNLALAEGFTNAVRHAHRGLPAETPIEIALALREDWIEIRIWDYGRPFNPDGLREPHPGTLQSGGYGWFLLRRLTDRVAYDRYIDGRNCLQLITYGFKHPV